MNACLPPVAGIVLIVLSVILTLLGGIVPSKKAAKEDPVTALEQIKKSFIRLFFL